MSKWGDSVFPDHVGVENHKNGEGPAWLTPEGGLSKRELFAAMAMQGLLSSSPPDQEVGLEWAAKRALQHADALLEVLEDEKE